MESISVEIQIMVTGKRLSSTETKGRRVNEKEAGDGQDIGIHSLAFL